ncbi:hypothetical protein P6709_06665 [Jeotgalibacillus sp. ET6]|uniref:hypothetical protein n=1 Tax=Jeotgalibacillus sp. ET6 TaxID=3037260 RepID=UPI0024181E15|nr:hypothetical protein [Jeotgalibacillus sp. ET6]MDG5471423.1 hypothetical protein [Jeotgalibacillus sp. ET6]
MIKIKNTFFIAVLLLLTGSCSTMNKAYDEDVYEESRKLATSFLQANYQDAENIEYTEVKDSPVGGLMLAGTINGAEFSVSISVSSDNSIAIGSIGKGENFPEIKPECAEQLCDY